MHCMLEWPAHWGRRMAASLDASFGGIPLSLSPRSTLKFGRVRVSSGGALEPKPAPFLATIVALVLSCMAPLIIISVTPEINDAHGFQGPMLIAAVSGLAYARVVGSRSRRLFEMVIWLYVYVFFGVAPMIQMRLGADTDTTPAINHELDWSSTSIVLVGCIAFALGVYLKGGSAPNPSPGTPRRGVHVIKANVLTLASLALFGYYVSKLGLSTLFLSRFGLDVARSFAWPDKTIISLVTGGTSMGLLVSTIAQMYVRRQRKDAGLPQPWLLPFLSFVALFVCVNPVNSARYVSGTVILAMLGAFGAYSTAKKFRTVALGAILGMVYLFPIADMFRRSLDPSAKSQNPLESMLSGDFDSFSQITNTVDYVNQAGITWGNQLVGVIFFWVPRGIWPDKATDTGVLLGAYKGYAFKNLSAPIWSELYINGGWLLLVLGMAVLGVVVGRSDRGNEALLVSTKYPSLVACIVPFYLLIVLRGSLLQSVAFMSVIIVACWFVREKPPKPADHYQPPRESLGNLPIAPAMMHSVRAPKRAVGPSIPS